MATTGPGVPDEERVVSAEHQNRARAMVPAGLWLLIPGYAQWTWGQRERGLVFFGSYAVAAGVGVFAWGTLTGLAVLAFAFGLHVASAMDAVQYSAFPPSQGRWTVFLGVALGLGVAVYGPSLAVTSMVAWPGMRELPAGSVGYLVNRWAYWREEPRQGDWVWYRATPCCKPRVGQVVAACGQQVEWQENRLRVDGDLTSNPPFLRSASPVREVSYRVPDGHVLIKPGDGPTTLPGAEGLVIVAIDQIVGRAWARMYPVRDRLLLD